MNLGRQGTAAPSQRPLLGNTDPGKTAGYSWRMNRNSFDCLRVHDGRSLLIAPGGVLWRQGVSIRFGVKDSTLPRFLWGLETDIGMGYGSGRCRFPERLVLGIEQLARANGGLKCQVALHSG